MKRGYGILFLCASLLILCLACEDTGYYSFLNPGKEPDPKLRVTPNSIILNAVEDEVVDPTDTVTVKNVGLRTLSWSGEVEYKLGDPGGWLFIDLPLPAEGDLVRPTILDAAPSEDVTIHAQITSPSLPPGHYSGWVVVTAPEADGSPKKAQVDLYLSDKTIDQEISVSPAELSFWCYVDEGEEQYRTAAVWNSGGKRLDWTATPSEGWLTLDPTTGLSTGEEDAIDVTADPATIHAARGRYEATIDVTDDGGVATAKQIDVDFDVFRKPKIASDGLAGLTFEALEADIEANDPAPQAVDIWNAEDRELACTASWSTTWLDVSPNTGVSHGPRDGLDNYDPTQGTAGEITPAGNEYTVDVSANPAGLKARYDNTPPRRTYTDDIVLSAPGASNSPVVMPVTFRIHQWADDFSDGNATQGNFPYSYVEWDESTTGSASWDASGFEYEGSGGTGEAVALAGNPNWKNYALYVDLDRGSTSYYPYIRFRYTEVGGDESYYRLRSDSSALYLYRVKDGVASFSLAARYVGFWYGLQLKIELYGDDITVRNRSTGDELIHYNDTSADRLRKGKIGFKVPSGDTVSFDNVKIRQLDAPPPRPDLRISQILSSDTSPVPRSYVDVTVRVTNAGGAPASDVRVDFFRNVTGAAPTVGDTSTYNRTIASIGAGQTASATFSNQRSNNQVRWKMYAIADTLDTVRESNEGNNVFGPTTLSWVHPSGDEYEPDDAMYCASSISLGETQTRSIYPSGDNDYVKFSLAAATSVTVETSGATGDTELYIYNSDGVLLYYDDYSGVGWFSRIVTGSLQPGSYYIRVRYWWNYSTIASYSLSLQ